MILQNGISVFGSNDSNVINEQYEDVCNINKLKGISYTIENKGVFRIIRFDSELVRKYFYYLEVEMVGKRIFILLNAIYPFIAFASNLQYMQIDFIDYST